MTPVDPDEPRPLTVAQLTAALRAYREARKLLLSTLALPMSNRDPLAEWAEHLVAALTGGQLAQSRVNPHYDLTNPAGETVQVRYLANTSRTWVNEHRVGTRAGVWWYALVLVEDFAPIGVLMFPQDLTEICSALRKRHPVQTTTLQLTRRDATAILDDPSRFEDLGMRIWLPPFPGDSGPTEEPDLG